MSQKSPSPSGLHVATDVDVEFFRAAMRELAGGVAVITVGKDQDISGFTATSYRCRRSRLGCLCAWTEALPLGSRFNDIPIWG
jgi:hypothetical protein